MTDDENSSVSRSEIVLTGYDGGDGGVRRDRVTSRPSGASIFYGFRLVG